MRVAVLGAGGLLGTHLVEELHHAHEPMVLARGQCDLGSPTQVADVTHGARLIINCGAYTNVDGAETHEADAYRANALGAAHAATAARLHGVPIVHISTDFVFAGDQTRPYDELDVPSPRSIYGRSKYAGEELVRWSGAHHFIVRVQALYGYGGRNFASRLRELIRDGKPLKLAAERKVQPSWVRAVARQIIGVATGHIFGTYHVSCKGAATWAEVARHIGERLKVAPTWQEVPSAALTLPAERPANCLFAHRMLSITGTDVMPDWRAALDGFLDEAAGKEEREAALNKGAPS